MVQILALPALIMMYTVDRSLAPAIFAAIGVAHFLPYVRLHRTYAYLMLGLAISLGRWPSGLSPGTDLVAYLIRRGGTRAVA